LEWLHQGCDCDLPADFRTFGAGDFPFKIPFKNGFKIVFFWLWSRDPVLELQFVLSLSTKKLLSVNTSLCKSLLCVKLSVCKSFLYVKAFFV